jgi:hypothetical protein
MKKFGIIAGFLFCTMLGTAQELPSTTEQQLENLTELAEEETEDDTFLQQLQLHRQHPLNINTASA